MNSKHKTVLFFAGNVFSFVFAMNYLRNFVYAWIFGVTTGSYTHTIDINQFNEANIELVLFVSAGIVVFVTTIYHMRSMANAIGEKQKKKEMIKSGTTN
jgi:hypothetical protein